MLTCGIHDGHNAAAALVRDGALVGAPGLISREVL